MRATPAVVACTRGSVVDGPLLTLGVGVAHMARQARARVVAVGLVVGANTICAAAYHQQEKMGENRRELSHNINQLFLIYFEKQFAFFFASQINNERLTHSE